MQKSLKNLIDLEYLRGKKNLLAFSAGVDSTALCFMLLQANIDFDFAMVDYQVRAQSKDEVEYAKCLAKKYDKKLFLHQAKKIDNDFENQARIVRYDFFKSIIEKYGYENLILAHHLNDRLEWFLMQFIKGSGLNTILGFEKIEERDTYKIVRPLFEISRDEIFDFVKNYQYFEDLSNQEMHFLRNKIRKNYANSLIKENKEGIVRSFQYLFEEKKALYLQQEVLQIKHIAYFKRQDILNNLYMVDRILKTLGYVWSKEQRQEVKKQDFSIQLASKFIIDSNERYIFVAPIKYANIVMSKEFKNQARKLLLPKKIRKEFFGLVQDCQIDLEKFTFC